MLTAARIRHLLEALNQELAALSVRGEIFLAGGAVMCLVFRAREATKDIDALLVPAAELRRAARLVGEREGLPPGWLNDAVKGFFSEAGRFDVFADFSHLRVYAPHPEYLLAMKCLAMRLGEDFQDRHDVELLLEILGVHNLEDAEKALARYLSVGALPGQGSLRARGAVGRRRRIVGPLTPSLPRSTTNTRSPVLRSSTLRARRPGRVRDEVSRIPPVRSPPASSSRGRCDTRR
jgi:hypothetical protein